MILLIVMILKLLIQPNPIRYYRDGMDQSSQSLKSNAGVSLFPYQKWIEAVFLVAPGGFKI